MHHPSSFSKVKTFPIPLAHYHYQVPMYLLLSLPTVLRIFCRSKLLVQLMAEAHDKRLRRLSKLATSLLLNNYAKNWQRASAGFSFHSVHWGINPPQKYHPLFLAKPPLFFGNPPPPPLLYWFFVSPWPKSWIFQWTPKILKFVILNNILSFKSN